MYSKKGTDKMTEKFDNEDLIIAGNPALTEAIKTWYDGGRTDFASFIDTVMEQIEQEGIVLLPVIMRKDEEGEVLLVQHLDTDEGTYWIPAFTSVEEVEKGEETTVLPQNLADAIAIAASEENCEGIYLNPWGDSMSLSKLLASSLLDACRPETEDEKDLNLGAEAYQEGDFETAIRYYEKSAAAGNVVALSNLGYCYYYGRSIPVDKAKARDCWEKAAILGDICAIYKLGDMYRNGDLPQDLVFSKKLYMKAYEEADVDRDPNNYPDTCLRIIKYCRDEYTREELTEIAALAVEGFEERIEDGDNYSGRLLREAKEILAELL